MRPPETIERALTAAEGEGLADEDGLSDGEGLADEEGEGLADEEGEGFADEVDGDGAVGVADVFGTLVAEDDESGFWSDLP